MMQKLEQTWRWYGPDDPVTLLDVKQAGAQGVVSALHHIPHGEIWPKEEIQKRKSVIEKSGLTWDVVESVNVHEDIKTRSGNVQQYIDNYKITLENLASCSIHTVCYNFMPVLDWTRTQLDYEVHDGSKALRLDWTDLAVFDCFILKRKGAEGDYEEPLIQEAGRRFKSYNKQQLKRLSDSILKGIPGEASPTTDQLRESIAIYKDVGHDGLRENLAYFLNNIMDVCEENNVKMTIHPDDPPKEILGLPRVASTKDDLEWITQAVNKKPNGICYCTGSLGAGKDNDLVDILRAVGDRVYFAHLRNVIKEADNSFYEADHLNGDNDMREIMKVLLEFQDKQGVSIPYRPDHGHQMLDDMDKTTNPGYSAIGRLRGLAELRGLEMGLKANK